MKRSHGLLAVTVAAGLIAFCVTRWVCREPETDEMSWLCQEFKLTTDQAGAIEKLRAAYDPVCSAHCRRIVDARTRLTVLEKSGQIGSETYLRTKAEWDDLSRECAEATRHHLAAVAAQMNTEQARRYLELVTPRLAAHDHETPLGVK